MIETKTLVEGIGGLYQQVENDLKSVGGLDLHSLRQKNLEQFLSVSMPTQRHEEWKYTSLREATATPFALPNRGATLADSQIPKVDGHLVVLVNGVFRHEYSDLSRLPKNVSVCSLRDAIAQKISGVERWLTAVATQQGKLGTTNDDSLIHLNNAFLTDGVFVSVPKNVVLEDPVFVAHVSDSNENALIQPRALYLFDEHSQACVIETFHGTGTYFCNSVTEVVVAQRAIVELTRVQDESRTATHIGHTALHQEGESTYTSNSINFGGRIGRHEITCWIDGEHAETWLNGAYVGKDNQVHDHRTRIDHAVPNCRSFEVYKGILDDDSIGVFNGKIFVYEDAQKTDAKQTNQALLLSPRATINTKPQLEIFADDVKCTHGATVGQLREDALFYLRSRGISESEAKSLLVYAFAGEVLDKVSTESVRKELAQRLKSCLASSL